MLLKIIALAIAGLSSAAFAQSNVTISGNLDMGYYSQSMQTATIMDTKAAAAANGSSTSTFRFTGSESLGGGMTAGFQLENDLAAGASSSSSVINAGSSFLSLSGNWGSLKAGNVNTAGLTAGTTAQPFGTAIGGGYSGAFARLSRAGINGTSAAGATAGYLTEGENASTTAGAAGISGTRTVRVNSSLRYDTPSFSGFGASFQYAAKNSDANVVATANTGGFQSLGLTYNNGPLNVAYANEQMAVGAVVPTGGGVPLGNVNEKVTHNLLAANYTFGPATVYGGWTSSKSSVAATADSRSWNLALKYAVSGALSLMANVVKVDDKLTTNQDRSLTGLGLDYALSKRTTAYGRYENGDNDKAASGTGNFTRYQIGMRHSF
jgi:predicted porin